MREAVLAATGGSLVKRVRRLLDSTGGAARRSDAGLFRRLSPLPPRRPYGRMANQTDRAPAVTPAAGAPAAAVCSCSATASRSPRPQAKTLAQRRCLRGPTSNPYT